MRLDIMRKLTDDQLLEIAETINCHGMPYEHKMTADEIGWLDFVRGKYSIADYLDERLDVDDVVMLDGDLSHALDDDNRGAGKAACLSDDTDLQAIFFYSYCETEEES